MLECLRDHPHGDTAPEISGRLGWPTAEDVEVALVALKDGSLVMQAAGHWQLTSAGWRSVGLGPGGS